MAWWSEVVALAVFFAAYALYGVYVAAGAAVVLAAADLGWATWRRQPLSTLHLLGAGLIILFGSLTVLFHNEAFIKVKPTLLYWAIVAVLVHRLVRNRASASTSAAASAAASAASAPTSPYIVQQMIAQSPEFIVTNPAVWRAVDAAWAGFFAVLGALNWAVAATASTDAWVRFKVFGVTAALAAAFVVQTVALHAANEYDLLADIEAAQQRRRAAAESGPAVDGHGGHGAGGAGVGFGFGVGVGVSAYIHDASSSVKAAHHVDPA